jgi:hypothetical protein
MRTFSHIRMQATGWAILLGIAVVCAQGSSAWAEVGAKVAKVKKPPSACVGLDEGACGGKAECTWRKAATLKSGKVRRAHCRKKPVHAAKAPT